MAKYAPKRAPMKPGTKKAIVISVVCLLLVGAMAAAWVLLPGREPQPVKVYNLSTVGYVYEDVTLGQTFTGTVRSDNLQTEYITNTQQVTKIYVRTGQVVEVGDPLFAYDTTLDVLTVERKDLEVQQLELNLKIAKDDLTQINKLKPMVIPATTAPTTAATEEEFEGALGDDESYKYLSGSWTSNSPAIWWLKENFAMDDTFVWELFRTAAAQRGKDQVDYFYVILVTREDDQGDGDIVTKVGMRFERVKAPVVTEPTEETQEAEASAQAEIPATEPDATGTAVVQTEIQTQSVTQEDTYKFTFFSVEKKQTPTTTPSVQINSGYTSNEIAQMRKEKTAEIKQLEFDLKMAQAELAIMEKELSDGIVRATVAGRVMEILTEDEALASGHPLVRISGGGAYLVTAYISEWYLDGVREGTQMSVTSWLTGERHVGTVYSISDFPAEQYSTQHESFYAVTIRVGEDSQLSVDYGVDVSFTTDVQPQTVYWLDQAFVREDEGGWYVWVADEEQKLEKRYVEVTQGDDNMVRILSGISESDRFAFPYGDDVAVGAPTELGSWEDLYG